MAENNGVKVVSVLVGVCLVCSMGVAGIYNATKRRIAENRTKVAREARLQVLPGAIKTEKMELKLDRIKSLLDDPSLVLEDSALKTGVVEAYTGSNDKGETVGAAIEVAPVGFSGRIYMIVGVGLNHRGELVVTGTRVLRHTETPGLGAEMTTVSYADRCKYGDKAVPAFQKQFTGKTLEQIVLKKDDPSKGTIDAITAATISSRAFTRGVRAALLIAKALEESGKLGTGGESK